MKKTSLLLLLIMVLMFCLSGSLSAAEPWDGTAETGWYTNAAEGTVSFEISTPAQLAGFASIVNEGTDTFAGKTITLTANLDLGGVYTSGAWDTANSKNWTPIGNSNNSAKQFAGTFDGNGKTISNIYIDTTAQYQGVFGYISASGKIKNLSVVSGSITSTATSVGGIAGYCYGYIVNCSNAATITGGGEVGGIAGDYAGKSYLINSFNEGNVNGTNTGVHYVGGLVGDFSSSGKIMNCYNLGDLNNFGMYGGGLVSRIGISATITNSYNAGNVTSSSSSFVANLIGRSYGSVSNLQNIYGLKTNAVNASLSAMAYPAGSALETTALKDSAALVDMAATLGDQFKAASGNYTYPILVWQEGGTYPADDADGLAIDSVSAENGSVTVVMNKALRYTALDKAQFTLTATIDGGDSQEIAVKSISQVDGEEATTVTVNFSALEATTTDQAVAMDVSFNGGSPVSAASFQVDQSNEWPAYGVAPESGDGTAENPYLLATAENLAWFAAQVNDGNYSLCARMTADIDLDGKLWPGIAGNHSTNYRYAYNGTFDGDGYVVKNLEMDMNVNSYQSCSGFINNLGGSGIIKNFGIESGTVSVSASGAYLGAICGYNTGIIFNCFNQADVSSSGLICIGGIAGACDASGAAIVNCYNSGDIMTDGSTVGGIVGTLSRSGSSAINVYNTGSVATTASASSGANATAVGGIVGDYRYGALSNAYNAGALSGGSGDYAAAGGIAGLCVHNQLYQSDHCYYLTTFLFNRGMSGVGVMKYYDADTYTYTYAIGEDQEGTSAVNKSDLQSLTSSLGSAFVEDSNTINDGYPILSWQAEGGTYPVDELEGLAVESVTADNGNVYVTLNKKLTYQILSTGDFAVKMHLSTEPEYYDMATSSISQDDSGEKTVVTLSFSSYAETTSAQTGAVKVSCLDSTPVEGTMTIDATLEWYPYGADGFAAGDGSEANPYQIATAEQLVYLANQVSLGETYADQYFILTADIDLGGKYWQPIGKYHDSDESSRLAFAGHFDGQNHLIHQIYIPFSGSNSARYSYAGLFGWSTGEISNVNLTGLIEGNHVGGIVAYNEGTIDHCNSYVTINTVTNGTYHAGGIASYSSGNITDCVNYGEVNDGSSSSQYSHYTGGIVGYVRADAKDALISRCANFGNVSGISNNAGISGKTDTVNGGKVTIEECYNAGQISGTYSGNAGITGYTTIDVTLMNCYNAGNIYGMTGNVSTDGNAGISVKGGHLVNCYNVGSLSSLTFRIAHIVANVSSGGDGGVSNCYYLDDGIYGGYTSNHYTPDFDITSMTTEDMKSTDFVGQLNGDSGSAFIADTNNVNDGYPILAWAADLNSNAPTGLSGGENKITGLDPEKTYEYKNIIDSGYTAVTADSSEIAGLDAGTYYVRYAETEDSAPSSYISVVVSGELNGSAYIPNCVSVGTSIWSDNMYGQMCFVNTQGLPKGATLSYQWFRYDNGNDKYVRISGAADRSYIPTAKDIGFYLYVEVYADGYDGCVSAMTAKEITKQRTEKPSDLTAFDCSAADTNDGKITGFDSSLFYEYKLSTESDYTTVAEGSTEVTGLAPGTYNVRCKETDIFYSSDPVSYMINDFATSLATAQTTAKNGLITALGTYTETDYSADNWTALNKVKTDGDTAIDAATTLTAVATAKQTAIDGMAAVKTLLATAKGDARDALATALAGYSESDYYAYQWSLLNKAKTDGDDAINNADSDGIETAKQTALDAMAAVKTKATLDANSMDITVNVDAQAENSFLVPYQSVTVNSTLAESYGYSDAVDADTGVSALDVLVKAHEVCYGTAFDGSQLTVNDGGISKLFDVATASCGFTVNGVQPHGDTLNESARGNYYDGYAVNQAVVVDNDFIEFFIYQDSYCLDNYGWFVQDGEKTDAITAKAGEDFTVALKGYAIAWYGCNEAATIENNTAAIEGAQLALVASDGTITAIKNAVTDENGSVTLHVAKEGSYYLTAYVPGEDIEGGDLPLLMPIANLTITAADVVVDVDNMTDVEDTWYYDSVAYVLAQGIMNGTSATTFDPDGNLTRGQFVTILGRYAGIADSSAESPATTNFSDVSATAYYAAHVAWAAENGITTGTSETTFSPNAKITRQDMAVMIVRFANTLKIELPDGSGAAPFADDGDIADYAKAAVYSMVKAEIINGTGNNKFSPKAYATRAQAAKIICLLIAYES